MKQDVFLVPSLFLFAVGANNDEKLLITRERRITCTIATFLVREDDLAGRARKFCKFEVRVECLSRSNSLTRF